jgi:hypothetical protein
MKTKITIAAVTKTFFMLIVSICLFSCGSYIPTDSVRIDPYVVQSIEVFDYGLCKYNLVTGFDHINYRDNITVVDSIGKFVIGDTLQFSLNKR